RALRPEPESAAALRPRRLPGSLSHLVHAGRGHRRRRMKRPANVLYDVAERMPPGVLFLSGLQHVGLMSMFLLYPVLIAKACDATPEVAGSLVSLTLVAMAAGTVL